MEGRRRLAGLVVAGALLAVPTAAGATSPPPLPTNAATDGPGALSHFDLARKDCVGTARNHRSKVWFTVADGVLSDVYFPTNDTTNNETLQYIVTDGTSFTDLQTRNMTYTVQALDDRALSCRVTATARSGRYRIVTDYFTDPDRPTVVMKSRFEALKGHRDDYKLYVRFDPTLNGNGGGGGGDNGNGGPDSGTLAARDGHTVLVGSDPVTKTNAVNRDYAVPVFSALDASRPFLAVSNGFAGANSDGLKQLDDFHRLAATFGRADNGNLVQSARVDLGRDGAFSLVLGFGQSSGEAVATAQRSLRADLSEYARGWHRYDARLVKPRRPHGVSSHTWDSLLDQYYLSANYVKAAEDKTFRGAVAAALTSPWGQAISAGDKNNTYFGSYREVFARDLYEAWTAVFLAGDHRTAKAMTRFLFQRQQLPDGSMPRNSLTNGKTAPDSFNTQLDECAYPLVMALAVGLTSHSYYEDHIKPAADFVASHGPSFGPERWEEQGGFSPSTISAEIAGLVAGAIIADRNGDHASAQVWRGVADEFQRNLKTWTLTTNGPASAQPYFIRLSKTGDPNAAISYGLGNGQDQFDQRSIIDAGFLEYARLGVMSEHDADILRSLDVVDATIKRSTVNGDGFFRYNHDGYGDRASDGRPWAPSGQGNGHLWPVLSGERGQWELDTGDLSGAIKRLQSMNAMGFGVGLIPEQAWELPDLARAPFGTDPTVASIGFTNGEAAGSAAALTWSAGQFVRLMLDVSADRVLDRPFYTRNRYVRHTQGETPLTVTAPADNLLVNDSVSVAGTSTPGNRIVVAATNIDADVIDTTTQTTTAGPGGAFSATLPVAGGTIVVNVVATDPATGATGREVRTVASTAPIGTLLFSTLDPTGDDHGPGNYAPPTAADFHDGAWDMQQFEIWDVPGDRIAFRVRNRDQSPTFGSPLGAQLIDVYVRAPGLTPTSTAASFPQRNYEIATGGAWNRLLEVQGFGQRLVDATGDVLGTINIRASALLRYITFSVPKSVLGGTPASGWQFTVVETGQDGFSPDQARGFQPTPQGFQFGVCATASADPHCTFDPGLVPKAVDVLTPAGVSQADELDYTLHTPVVIAPIAIP
jgi:glucan 1,4-alpha-glucosidase